MDLILEKQWMIITIRYSDPRYFVKVLWVFWPFIFVIRLPFSKDMWQQCKEFCEHYLFYVL